MCRILWMEQSDGGKGMEKKKILVALSGGVDSSTCVALLKEQGYEVAGVVLRMSRAHDQTVQDAKLAAEQLGIPLYVKDMETAFSELVIRYFMDEYAAGRTPNPCVVCNPLVKFRGLVETADEHGYPVIATGHYAGLRKSADGERVFLTMAESRERDQSYMLCRLTQKELKRLYFPLADLPKPEVRRMAAEAGLSCAGKPDSQEICFIPDGDYAGYIEARRGEFPEGDYISPEGKICGRHKGIIHYTVGQRKKLGIALGKPVFIKRIDPAENRIYLAWGGEEYENEVTVRDVSETYPGALQDGMHCGVKVRSRAAVAPCTLYFQEDGKLRVVFDKPERAPAAGQTAAFYDGDVVLGGGFIV